MNYPDFYTVPTWTQPLKGTIQLPGSKSLTNRALIVAALTGKQITLKGALFSRDTELLVNALKGLGIPVLADEEKCQITVSGCGGQIPNRSVDLFVGNAGTAARFLTALVAVGDGGAYRFDGDHEMRRRPMAGLLNCLRSIGAKIVCHEEEGHFPFTVEPSGLKGGVWAVDSSESSQMLSALMMVAPFASDDVTIQAPRVRPAFIKMTQGIMASFGVEVEADQVSSSYRIPIHSRYRIEGGNYIIEPDMTAASYFCMLPLVVGGEIEILNVSEESLQGDVAFLDVLSSLGARVEFKDGALFVFSDPFSGSVDVECDFQNFSDTFLTLAAVTPLLDGKVSIAGIGHTRFQETDRIAGMADNLQRLGLDAKESETGLDITSINWKFTGASPLEIKTFHDHRFAMSFAIAGSRRLSYLDKSWITIVDPGCCRKTFPKFFVELENLYRLSHDR